MTWPMVGQPQSAIALSSSSRRMLSTRVAPASPSTARPQRTGRPMPTALAPAADEDYESGTYDLLIDDALS